VIVTSEISIRYLTGLEVSDAVVVAVRNGENYLITDFRYIEIAKKVVKDAKVITYTSKYVEIDKIFKKYNIKQVHIESMYMTVAQLDSYQRIFKNIEFCTDNQLSDALNKCRIVKEPCEIEKMIQAQRIAEKALEITLGEIKVGISEREIALLLEYNMKKLGADDISFETIALSGKNTSMPHGVPSDKKVQEHEFVLMDFGAVVDGYHSDMTRTVCVGTPSEEMEKVYNVVLKAQKKALEAARAGISGKEFDAVARDVIVAAGYGDKFGHSLGHGVGLEIHELPVAAPRKKDTILAENNVITVEPGIYLPDKFGVRIEDFVVIGKDSCMNMTLAPKELIIL
jgi:Xaa-Pro aminopeptidase